MTVGELPDHYETLDVRPDATPIEITRAYRRAMKRSHPDRHAENDRATAEADARRINAAYATLSRPEQRRRYDQTRRQRATDDGVMGRYVNAGFSPDVVSQAKREATQPYRRPLTESEEREMRRAEHAAYAHLGYAFGAFVLGIVVVVIAAAIFAAILRAAF
ncbi:MAG TPA: DnaJ domain-containing protein [Thermomicrobiales bacterium]|jgi:curved DNA-binding protein CbpA|nr:DnaJ domain-containing protein [Thermomicrobiales bacterium]